MFYIPPNSLVRISVHLYSWGVWELVNHGASWLFAILRHRN